MSGSKGKEEEKESEEEEDDECGAFFSVGQEYTPEDMKTSAETAALRKAWFSDIPNEQHGVRIEEERLFLAIKKQNGHPMAMMKMPNHTLFPSPARTIPVGVGPMYSVALEFVHQEDFDAVHLQEHLLDEEITQLVHYFKERLQRSTTVRQVRGVGGELNTRVKVEKNAIIQKTLLDDVLPLIIKRLKDAEEAQEGSPEALLDDPEGLEKDMRGEPIHRPVDKRPTHSVTRLLLRDHPLDERHLSAGAHTKKKKTQKKKKKKKKKQNVQKKGKNGDKLSSMDMTAFNVLVCPTPMINTSKKASNKRCQWRNFLHGKMLFCDKGTVPMARIHDAFFLLCYRYQGILKVQVYAFDKQLLVYSYVVENLDSLGDCYFDWVGHKVALTYNTYVLVIHCDVRVRSSLNNPQTRPTDAELKLEDTDATATSLISVRYQDDPHLELTPEERAMLEADPEKELPATIPSISSIYVGYGEIVVGTTRGGCLTFRADAISGVAREHVNATYQTTSSTCPIRSIHRTGGNLYATNIMYAINLQTPDANSFARGMEISTTGSLFFQDRVVAIDSCGALLASLDKNGILQVQTNRLCLDPEDPTKVLSSQVYSLPPKEAKDDNAPREAPFINYQAVYLARRRLLCMYPTGQIQCFWIVINEDR